MNKIDSKDIYTDRLELRIPTMNEQYRLWEILIIEDVNKYFFPTPYGIFIKNNFSKVDITDIKTSAADINPGSWKIMEKLGLVIKNFYLNNKLNTNKLLVFLL